ncbi:MAG: hypothetical protein QOH47_2208 [Sphingomonadales bacterium]|jgi:hypothetical protein|nr:hypothetical protein [Sphingomonadales bacterium]
MRYSEHIDYLQATVVYLATQPRYWGRRATHLALELSLDEARLRQVLQGFPGIFRRSPEPGADGEYYYALQARYALRMDFKRKEYRQPIPPLPPDMIKLIYDFVLRSADDERSRGRLLVSNSIAVTAAIVSAFTAIYVATVREAGTATPAAVERAAGPGDAERNTSLSGRR